MKADLHVHSCHSYDGSLRPIDILRVLRSRGFCAVAILDHDGIDASLDAYRIGKENGMIVIRGSEISSKEGHIGALGITELVPPDLTPEETIDKVHDLGGVAVALHPFRWHTGVGEKVVKRCKFDAVEVINGKTGPKGNRRAEKLGKAMNLPPTAGSDSHFEFDLGKSYVMFRVNCENEEQMIEAILRGEGLPEGEGRSLSDSLTYGKKTLRRWLRGRSH
ncbi:MAG TPA: PHP domain-containing protein [Euryarchaeota archaeon]|nr:PHP domain-containing protein [Euryarchaeota archaeon]